MCAAERDRKVWKSMRSAMRNGLWWRKSRVAGDDLYLTIDIRLAKNRRRLLGEETGAIVALDPTNGDVLAMASRPGFDPNVLVEGIDKQTMGRNRAKRRAAAE